MPLVEISLFEGRNEQQKIAIAQKVTEALVSAGGAEPASISIIFRELPSHDWLRGDELLETLGSDGEVRE